MWILYSVVFHALTLKLPIETSVSVAPKLPVSLSSHEKLIRFTSESDTCLSLGGQHGPFALGDSNTDFYRPQTKFAKVMFYTCLSVIMFTGGGEYLGRYTGTYPLGPGKPPGTRYTPWDQVYPPEPGTPLGPGTPPGTEYTPPPGPGTLPLDQVHPPGPGTPPPPPPWDQVHPPGPGTPPKQCMLGDTGNKRAVRILLECILVHNVNMSSEMGGIVTNLTVHT